MILTKQAIVLVKVEIGGYNGTVPRMQYRGRVRSWRGANSTTAAATQQGSLPVFQLEFWTLLSMVVNSMLIFDFVSHRTNELGT